MTDLVAQLVDLFNGLLYIAVMDGIPYFHALLDRRDVLGRLYSGLHGKPFGGRGVAFADEIVHDDEIDIAIHPRLY